LETLSNKERSEDICDFKLRTVWGRRNTAEKGPSGVHCSGCLTGYCIGLYSGQLCS